MQELRSQETWYKMFRDSFTPLLTHMESKGQLWSAASRTHLPSTAPTNQIESYAFMAKVAELTCLLIGGKDALGSKSVPEIMAELDETWETHSFTGKRHGEVRGKCVNTDEPDSYSADLESVYGIKFRSPIKAIHANSQKAKQRANTTI